MPPLLLKSFCQQLSYAVINSTAHKLLKKRPFVTSGDDTGIVDDVCSSSIECLASDFTSKQLERVTIQCVVIADLCRALFRKYRDMCSIYSHTLSLLHNSQVVASVMFNRRLLKECSNSVLTDMSVYVDVSLNDVVVNMNIK
jgi:hypothetical protein